MVNWPENPELKPQEKGNAHENKEGRLIGLVTSCVGILPNGK